MKRRKDFCFLIRICKYTDCKVGPFSSDLCQSSVHGFFLISAKRKLLIQNGLSFP